MKSWAYPPLTPAVAGICLFLLAGCLRTGEYHCFHFSDPPPSLSVRLRESLVLGAEASSSRNYLFGDVRFVQTDQAGHIYVADRASMEVKVYGPDGQHLRSIGGRGREPGRFRVITCMWVSDDGSVVVIDGLNKRITFMNFRGEVLKTKPVDIRTMLWPRRMQEVGRQFAFLYKLPASRGNSDGLFHLFDLGIERETDRFGSFRDFGFADEALELSYLEVNPGYFWAGTPQAIFYSPSLYRGKLYRLSRIGDVWQTTQILCGHIEGEEPLSEVKGLSAADQGRFSFVTSRKGRKRFGILRNESRGVFTLNDGRIVHFTLIERLANKVFGMEVYRPDGQLAGYAPLEKTPLTPGQAVDIPISVHWKDSRDRFYLVDRREIPTLKVVTLEIDYRTENPAR